MGQKGKNEGILLLLAIQDRRSRLEIGYGLEPILPDGLAGIVLREMRPALRQQQYGEALMAAARDHREHDREGQERHRSMPACRGAFSRPERTAIPVAAGRRRIFLLLWLMRSGGPRGYGGRGGGGFLPG